jgi:hypothetical protein
MSNIKSVYIAGRIPFSIENKDLLARFGQMSLPVFGIKIEFIEGDRLFNKHGGTTLMYDFTIQGEEAISTSWLESFMKLVVLEEFGKIVCCEVKDIENNETLNIDVPTNTHVLECQG